jgi:hypothetical protein
MNRLLLLVVIPWLAFVPTASAEYVIPQMGGGQVGQGAAPMKHADITFDGTSLQVHLDETVGTPLLRALNEPNEFDPAQPWNVLNDKAYNFQHGWNPGGFISLPSGTWIWMEQLFATPGLEVYQRPPASPAYAPAFGTAGSAARWRWSGAMTHNVYAVPCPLLSQYEASYRVYIGDNTSGEPLPAYASADVTFHFLATPVLPGDYNHDDVVDAADYSVWRDGLGAAHMQEDYSVWKSHFGWSAGDEGSAATGFAAVPEPSGLVLSALAILAALAKIAGKKVRPGSPERKLHSPFSSSATPAYYLADSAVLAGPFERRPSKSVPARAIHESPLRPFLRNLLPDRCDRPRGAKQPVIAARAAWWRLDSPRPGELSLRIRHSR